MMSLWSPDELERIRRAEELQIAAKRADRDICAERCEIWESRAPVDRSKRLDLVPTRQALVRSRGGIATSAHPRPSLEADIAIEDIGAAELELRASVDAAYRAKCGPTE